MCAYVGKALGPKLNLIEVRVRDSFLSVVVFSHVHTCVLPHGQSFRCCVDFLPGCTSLTTNLSYKLADITHSGPQDSKCSFACFPSVCVCVCFCVCVCLNRTILKHAKLSCAPCPIEYNLVQCTSMDYLNV